MMYMTIEEKNTAIEYFGDQALPALIVEGKTDIIIYGYLLKNSNIDWSTHEIINGECKSNIITLHDDNKILFPYIALIDADYDLVNNTCRVDSKLIYTHFYTLENYLTHEDVISKAIEHFSILNNISITATQLISESIENIKPLIVACALKLTKNLNIALEKYSIEHGLFWNTTTKKISKDKMINFINAKLIEQGNSPIEVNDWIQTELFVETHISINQIGLIVNGKHLIESVFHSFRKYFPEKMSARNKEVFKLDISSYLTSSYYAQELLSTIELKLFELKQIS